FVPSNYLSSSSNYITVTVSNDLGSASSFFVCTNGPIASAIVPLDVTPCPPPFSLSLGAPAVATSTSGGSGCAPALPAGCGKLGTNCSWFLLAPFNSGWVNVRAFGNPTNAGLAVFKPRVRLLPEQTGLRQRGAAPRLPSGKQHLLPGCRWHPLYHESRVHLRL